jgi:geranylgeranyl pyrophosphate synthase
MSMRTGMAATEGAAQAEAAVHADAEQLEADLRDFTAEVGRGLTGVPGIEGSAGLEAALRRTLHGPVADALGSKVGQEALRLSTASAGGGPARLSGPLRPSIVYWTFRNYRGFADTGAAAADLPLIRRVAVAIRVLLKAAVVLDDIEDGSAVRYGEAALHVTHGVPVGLNTGCWMVLAALRHVDDPAVVADIIQAVSNGFTGQAADMSTRLPATRHGLITASARERVSFWESVATLKTSTLFQMPLNAAAVAVGVPAEEREALNRGMRLIGLASQLFNDLTDFMPEFGGANTYEDFDGLTNRVCLELLGEGPERPELAGGELRQFALDHPRLKATMARLAAEAVQVKEAGKDIIHRLCRSPVSAAYIDMTIERKGHGIDRLYQAMRAGQATRST